MSLYKSKFCYPEQDPIEFEPNFISSINTVTVTDYPSIGPDISYICPSDKKYRAGLVWYLQKDIAQNIAEDDKKAADDLDNFFKQIESFKQVINNNIDINNKDLQISGMKNVESFHLSFQYFSCVTEDEIKTIKSNLDHIVKHDDIMNIIKNNKNGYKSWSDVQVCFDRVLCMNDNYYGGYMFNLYLDDESQKLMRDLVTKMEEIEEDQYNIDLTFKRVKHQQAFHISLAAIANTMDYKAFDAADLMDVINKEMNGKWPCIKLAVPPPLKDEWCFNSKKLKKDKLPKFQWKCAPIE